VATESKNMGVAINKALAGSPTDLEKIVREVAHEEGYKAGAEASQDVIASMAAYFLPRIEGDSDAAVRLRSQFGMMLQRYGEGGDPPGGDDA
jgi:hypothetical protein